MADLHDLTALEAAAAVRRGEVSPVELVEHALDRIERLDGQIGAFVTVTAERRAPRRGRPSAAVRVRRRRPTCRRCSACRPRSRT